MVFLTYKNPTIFKQNKHFIYLKDKVEKGIETDLKSNSSYPKWPQQTWLGQVEVRR